MEKIACDTNSMKQLSCAPVVFPLSSVQLSVFVRLFTQHHATNTPCRTPSAIAPRPRTESTAIDSIISTLACATSVPTCAPATAQILTRVEFAMSLSSCACSVQSCKTPFLPASHDQLHTAHSARPLHRWMHRRRVQPPIQPHRTFASRSRYILQNVAQFGPKPVVWSTEQSCHTQNGNTHAVRNSCTHATVTIVFGHNRFLIHAHAHLDENTSVKRKTNKETLNKHACHLTETCPHSEDMNSRLVFHFPRSAQVTKITSSLCRILEEQFETFDTRAIFARYQFQSRLHIFLGVRKSLTIPHLTVETPQITTSTIVLRSDPTKRMTHSSCVNLLVVPTLERVCLPVTNFSQTFRFHTESDAFAKNFLLVSICQLPSRF